MRRFWDWVLAWFRRILRRPGPDDRLEADKRPPAVPGPSSVQTGEGAPQRPFAQRMGQGQQEAALETS